MTALRKVVKRTFVLLILCLLLTSLCSAAPAGEFAVGPPQGATTQASGVKHRQPNDETRVAPVKIFSNLGPLDDFYDATHGWFVSGINNLGNDIKQDIAMPFTPTRDATVTRVKAALQYYNFGGGQPNGALLAIYDDAAGLPGKALAHRLRGNFDDFGSGCCNLALWTLTTPLPVKAGTQYWVVGTTNSKSMDNISMWDWVFDDAPATIAFQQNDGGWILLDQSYGYSASAVAVRGTVP